MSEQRKHVYGWVSSVCKSLPVPLDYDGQPGYNLEPADFDWWVTVTDEKGTGFDFQMSAAETHPMPLLGKWVEVLIEGLQLTFSAEGKTVVLNQTAKNLIVRE